MKLGGSLCKIWVLHAAAVFRLVPQRQQPSRSDPRQDGPPRPGSGWWVAGGGGTFLPLPPPACFAVVLIWIEQLLNPSVCEFGDFFSTQGRFRKWFNMGKNFKVNNKAW